MTGNQYQALASRTQNTTLTHEQRELHALHGLASEVGEIHSIFQHVYQGEALDNSRIVDECGDLCWFLCELLDCIGESFEHVLEHNVVKLKKRYPNGFDDERSVNRHNI